MVDINVKLGHWPYRPVKGLDTLLRYMDEFQVSRAAVSSLNAVHYLNPQDGNDELATVIAQHRNRLLPLAVIRPNFTGWQDDLNRCAGEYGAHGVVLYPNYHGYALSDDALKPLADLAATRRWPIFIQAGLEDPRRQFRRPIIPEVPASDITGFAIAYPHLTVIALGLKFRQPEAAGTPLPPNFFFDTSNYEAMGDLQTAVTQFGPEKILFGTNFPLFTPVANVHKLRHAVLTDAQRQAIAHQNAHHLLSLG